MKTRFKLHALVRPRVEPASERLVRLEHDDNLAAPRKECRRAQAARTRTDDDSVNLGPAK